MSDQNFLPQTQNTHTFFDDVKGNASSFDYKNSGNNIFGEDSKNKIEVYNIDYWKNNTNEVKLLKIKSEEDITVTGQRNPGFSDGGGGGGGIIQQPINNGGHSAPNDGDGGADAPEPEQITVLGHKTKFINGKHYLLGNDGGLISYQNRTNGWTSVTVEGIQQEVDKDIQDIMGRKSNDSDIDSVLSKIVSKEDPNNIRHDLSQTQEAKDALENMERRIINGVNNDYTHWAQDSIGNLNDWNLDKIRQNLAGTSAAKDAVEKLQQSIIGSVNNDYTPWAIGNMHDYQDWNLDKIRQNLAGTSAATNSITSLYQKVVGISNPNDGQVSYYRDIISKSGDLNDIKTDLAYSNEGRTAITDLYQKVVGVSNPNNGQISYFQSILANSGNLHDVQTGLAYSNESRSDITSEYLKKAGISNPNDGQISYFQGVLANSGNFRDVQTGLAYSQEAKDKINSLYQALKGRLIDDTNLAEYQQNLANNGPMPGTIMASVFASTGETALAGEASGAAATVLLGESFFGPPGWAAAGATAAGIAVYNNWDAIRSEWDSLRSALSQDTIPVEAIQQDIGLKPFAYQPIARTDLPAVAAEAQDTAERNNCRIQFVTEPKPGSEKQAIGRAYEDQGPNGGLIDSKSGLSLKPALMYEKNKILGADFVKFDNWQVLPNGQIKIIDRKVWIPGYQKSNGVVAFSKTIDQLQRQTEALKQNPGCIGVHQVPDEKQKNMDDAILRQLGITNISVEIAHFDRG